MFLFNKCIKDYYTIFTKIIIISIFLLGLIKLILLSFLSNNLEKKNIIGIHHSKYNTIWIYETDQMRCMSFDPPKRYKIVQTCVDLNNHSISMLNYAKIFLGALYIKPDPKQILILGLGGGVIAKSLHYLIKNARIDIVEINPEVIEVVKIFFNFETTNNINIINEDAYDYIKNNNNTKYDLIIFDVDISNNHNKDKFINKDFFSMIKKIMNENSVVAANFFTDKTQKSTKEFYDVFTNDNYILTTNGSNILIGTNNKISSLKKIKDNADKWEALFDTLNINTQFIVKKFESNHN